MTENTVNSKTNSRPSWGLILTLICIIGLGIRLYVLQETEFIVHLRADAKEYMTAAWNLAFNGVYSADVRPPLTPYFHRPPGYPIIIVFLLWIVGPDNIIPAVQILQVVSLSLLPILVFMVCRVLTGPGFALIPAFFTAVSPVLITTPEFIATESFFTVALFFSLWTIFSAYKSEKAGSLWMLSGCLIGFAMLIRPSLTLFPFFIGALLCVFFRLKTILRPLAPFIIGLVLVAGAWPLHNKMTTGKWTFMTGNGLITFAHGCYPEYRYKDSPYGYPYRTDPEFREFTKSYGSIIKTFWNRAQEDPWPYIKWWGWGKWMTLWSYNMVQSDRIYIYPTGKHPFKPGGGLETWAWASKGLYPIWVFCFWAGTAFYVLSRRRIPPEDEEEKKRRFLLDLLFGTVLYFTFLHGIINPLPRYMIPMRPLIFLLGTWGVLEGLKLFKSFQAERLSGKGD